MAGGLLGALGLAKPRRRSRPKGLFGLGGGGGGGWSGVDTVMTIAAIGAVGFIGFFVLKSGKGVDEGLQTAGDWAKDFVDAVNATGESIGSWSKGAQDWSYGLQKGVSEKVGGAGESVGNALCWAQKLVNPGLPCTDLNKKDMYVLMQVLTAGGMGAKPRPKITNDIRRTMLNMGIYYPH